MLSSICLTDRESPECSRIRAVGSVVRFSHLFNMLRTPALGDRRSRRKGRDRRDAPVWVRKSMMIDQTKLDQVKRMLKAPTERDAVDAALEDVAFRHRLLEGIRRLRRSGGLADFADER
jgi:hypothetical protein